MAKRKMEERTERTGRTEKEIIADAEERCFYAKGVAKVLHNSISTTSSELDGAGAVLVAQLEALHAVLDGLKAAVDSQGVRPVAVEG